MKGTLYFSSEVQKENDWEKVAQMCDWKRVAQMYEKEGHKHACTHTHFSESPLRFGKISIRQ